MLLVDGVTLSPSTGLLVMSVCVFLFLSQVFQVHDRCCRIKGQSSCTRSLSPPLVLHTPSGHSPFWRSRQQRTHQTVWQSFLFVVKGLVALCFALRAGAPSDSPLWVGCGGRSFLFFLFSFSLFCQSSLCLT